MLQTTPSILHEPEVVLPNIGDHITSQDTGITYRIGAPFDEGGFGRVFACNDDWGHDLVAKVLRPVGPPAEMEVRASEEVLASAIVRSPHIVHVHDAFVYRNTYYIISERCSRSLEQLMQSKSVLPKLWFRPLAKALLHALHYTHSRGLMHCDVHPGNILLHDKPDILLPKSQSAFDFKLGDFGQARPVNADRARPTWNDNCMPPEVLDPIEFGPIDHRADLYQAGLVFLHFLSPDKLSFDHVDVLKGKPRELAESLPHPAAPGIAWLLRRHAEARPNSGLAAWRYFDELLTTQ